LTRSEHLRKYQWAGSAASAASSLSDMPGLRQLLFGVALQDLKVETEKRYHIFRKQKLLQKEQYLNQQLR
jgi:septin family protein